MTDGLRTGSTLAMGAGGGAAGAVRTGCDAGALASGLAGRVAFAAGLGTILLTGVLFVAFAARLAGALWLRLATAGPRVDREDDCDLSDVRLEAADRAAGRAAVRAV